MHKKNNQHNNTLLLIDGSSYLYRAFHAGGDWSVTLADGSKQPTGALLIMVNMLQALEKDYPAAFAVCVFDAKGKNFRHDIYTDYKAQRAAMPDDLRRQVEPIYEMVQLHGWKTLAVEGVEADDVIGTLAKVATTQGMQVVISSGDKDLSQLVDMNTIVIDTMNGKRRDIDSVQVEFGVPPKLMVDYQALVGDTVDNIPGVPKVGAKTAAKWLQKYGSLDAIIEHANEIKGVVGNNLRQTLDWLPTAKELVSIKTDCALDMVIDNFPKLDALKRQPCNIEALKDFYKKYQFASLLKKLNAQTAQDKPLISDLFSQTETDAEHHIQNTNTITNTQYDTITNQEQLEAWLQTINSAELTAIDTETTSLNFMQAHLVGISLCVEGGKAAYVPLGHNNTNAPKQLELNFVLEQLKPWLEDENKPKLGQHTKYDQHIFANYDIFVKGYCHDTMLQSYVLQSHKSHNLDAIALRTIGYSGISYEELCGKGVNQISFAQVDVQQATQYACEDVDFCLQAHKKMWPQIQDNPKLNNIYQLEIATSNVLFQIERNGVCLNSKQLAQQSNTLGIQLIELEQAAYKLAGTKFNLGSPKQIGEILFNKLGLPVIKKTATGAASTNEAVLEKLAEDYALPKTMLEHRKLAKLKNTYTDKLPQMVNPQTGKVHTNYAQAVAVTGRLSSSDPNLQNIPIRTPEGRRIRETFIAPESFQIASADYSQIELRIMAHLSQDSALVQAFENKLDIHRATAAEIFGIDVEDVNAEQRRYAKVINFGLIYGMSSYGLAKSLGIDNTSARNYIERYFERYPKVYEYMEYTRELAKAQGYVETVLGRRLYLPEINSPNGVRRNAAERAAINAPMQGTAADLIKMSMVELQQLLSKEQRRTRIIMQVHDELVLEVPENEIDWVRETVPKVMASVANLRVPLVADIGFGKNWEEAH